MSFGFAVGDFLAVGRIIYDIVDALRGSSAEYQELIRELESLDRALKHVDSLKGHTGQTRTVDHVKCAALTCRLPLEDFQRKVGKFDSSLGVGSSAGRLERAARKVHWGLHIGKKDVDRLRNYLEIHIGTINMQLIQHGLEKLDILADGRLLEPEALQSSVEESLQEMRQVTRDVQNQTVAIGETRSIMQTLLSMIQGNVAAPLKSMIFAVAKLCISTQQIYDNQPVRVEDALGRSFPFPAEFCVAALHVEIGSRFREGPGKFEVTAGLYEIFDARNPSHILNSDDGSILIPNMTLHMAVNLASADTGDSSCPAPDCRSRNIKHEISGKKCMACGIWFKNDRTRPKYYHPYVDAQTDTDATSLPRQADSTSVPDSRTGISQTGRPRSLAKTHISAFRRISFLAPYVSKATQTSTVSQVDSSTDLQDPTLQPTSALATPKRNHPDFTNDDSDESLMLSSVKRRKRYRPQATKGDAVLLNFLGSLNQPKSDRSAAREAWPLWDDFEFDGDEP